VTTRTPTADTEEPTMSSSTDRLPTPRFDSPLQLWITYWQRQLVNGRT
jgi:hypothetical protein